MFNKVTFWRVWDPLTEKKFRISTYELEKYGDTTTIAKAKKKLEEENILIIFWTKVHFLKGAMSGRKTCLTYMWSV